MDIVAFIQNSPTLQLSLMCIILNIEGLLGFEILFPEIHEVYIQALSPLEGPPNVYYLALVDFLWSTVETLEAALPGFWLKWLLFQ